MTRLREDPALDLPPPPERIPALGSPEAGLALAGPARPARFLVEGEDVSALGSERGVVEIVRIGRGLVARDAGWRAGAVANVLVHPGLVQRERAGSHGLVTETIVAAPRLPLVAFQLATPTRAPARFGLTLPLEGTSVGFRATPGLAAVRSAGGDVLAVAVSPPTGSIRLIEEGASDVRVEIETRAATPATVLLTAGPLQRVRSALAAAAHLAAHARTAAQATLPDGLTLATGVGEVDEGVHWARARLHSAVARAAREQTAGPRPSALWAVVASLGVGDRATTDRALRLVLDVAEALGPSSTSAARADEAELLAARAALAFGDVGATSRPRAASSETGAAPARPVGRGAAAESFGRPATAISKGLALPVVGGSDPERISIEWLRSLLDGEPGRPPRAPSPDEEPALNLPWLFRVDPDAAWARWRGLVAQGLGNGPDGAGTWDALDEHALVLHPRTSSLLSAIAFGLLGLSSDAPAGRLRLAPHIPSHLTRFRVGGLTLGTVRLAMRYERDGRLRRFTLEPEHAHVPPMVVFEPAVEGRVQEVRVDGSVADLDLRAVDGRTVVPVQLPVDGARTVEIACS